MNKVIKIVLIFFVIFSINFANFVVKNQVEAVSEPVQFIFRTDKTKYNVGDTVIVTCEIKNGAANGFLGYDGMIAYDSNMLKYESCNLLLNTDEWTLKYNNSTKKILMGYDVAGDGLSKDGDIFQMKFTALKEGSFNVDMTDVSLDADSTKYDLTAASSIIVPKDNTNTNTDAGNEKNNNTITNTDADNNNNKNTNTNTNTNTNANANTNTNVNTNTNANINANANTNSLVSDANFLKKDSTVANKIIPQTGVSTKVLFIILIVAIIGAVAGAFYDKYKNIK